MKERETWDNLCEDQYGRLRYIDTDRFVPKERVNVVRVRAEMELVTLRAMQSGAMG